MRLDDQPRSILVVKIDATFQQKGKKKEKKKEFPLQVRARHSLRNLGKQAEKRERHGIGTPQSERSGDI